MTFMFVNVGPCMTIVANVVTPNMRASALAIATLLMHLLGDIWSPSLIGWVADYCGQIGHDGHRLRAHTLLARRGPRRSPAPTAFPPRTNWPD